MVLSVSDMDKEWLKRAAVELQSIEFTSPTLSWDMAAQDNTDSERNSLPDSCSCSDKCGDLEKKYSYRF